MNNSEAAYALSELLGSDVTDEKLKKQQDTFNLVLRIIHENISFENLTDNEVEQLAMYIPQAVSDYESNEKMFEDIAKALQNVSPGYHRHLI